MYNTFLISYIKSIIEIFFQNLKLKCFVVSVLMSSCLYHSISVAADDILQTGSPVYLTETDLGGLSIENQLPDGQRYQIEAGPPSFGNEGRNDTGGEDGLGSFGELENEILGGNNLFSEDLTDMTPLNEDIESCVCLFESISEDPLLIDLFDDLQAPVEIQNPELNNEKIVFEALSQIEEKLTKTFGKNLAKVWAKKKGGNNHWSKKYYEIWVEEVVQLEPTIWGAGGVKKREAIVGYLVSDSTFSSVAKWNSERGLVIEDPTPELVIATGSILKNIGITAIKSLARRNASKIINDFNIRCKDFGNLLNKSAAPAKRASNKTVLGKHPDYVKLSDKLGARRFQVPTRIWDKMSDGQRWIANQKFLDRMISKGDEIILSTPVSKAPPGSSFFREIEYLRSKGYRVSGDGLRMLPEG